jgi:hypothetical protein
MSDIGLANDAQDVGSPPAMFVEALCTKNLGRDIVDTYFHASPVTCTT